MEILDKTAGRLTSLKAKDIVVHILILALSAVPFFLYEKAPDFVNTDVHYVDLADSLLHSHSYSTNFTQERLQPPGLPVILASICTTVGCAHDILTRTMPVFLALGLLFSYEVVRRQRGRFIAAASCLLLAASPSIFPVVTSQIWAYVSLFFHKHGCFPPHTKTRSIPTRLPHNCGSASALFPCDRSGDD
jgi:hypothetical protein